MKDKKGFAIVPADSGNEYEGLRDLWCEVFGDDPSYVDKLYDCFGADVKGYAVTERSGAVCSALTCYRCGTYSGRPVYVSYAICTRPDMRGQGLAAMLTAYVRDKVVRSGGISIVSPAEPSLEAYYAALGYEPFFFAAERSVAAEDADAEEFIDFDDYDLDFGDESCGELFKPEAELQTLTAEQYNKAREEFLSGRPHVELSKEMMYLVRADTADGRGFYSVNRGDAVFALAEAGKGRSVITELIPDPRLREMSEDISDEIALMIAEHFGDSGAVYRSPGGDSCQSMACGIADAGTEAQCEPYFGFPVD